MSTDRHCRPDNLSVSVTLNSSETDEIPHRHAIHKTWILRSGQKKHRARWRTTPNDNLENARRSNRCPCDRILIFNDAIAINTPCPSLLRRLRPSFPRAASKELGAHFRMHNQAGTPSEFIADSGYFSRAEYMRVRPRDSRASGQNYRGLFFLFHRAGL